MVFVVEQEVDAAEEYDEFDDSSVHFLTKMDGSPVGTARWRFTANGVKLERFAVRKEARGKVVLFLYHWSRLRRPTRGEE